MMQRNFAGRCLTGLVVGCVLLLSSASASVLQQNLPYSGLVGQQSDGGTPAYIESIPVSAPVKISSFTWWGYDLGGVLGAINNFDLMFGGSSVVSLGTLNTGAAYTINDSMIGSVAVTEYTLDFGSNFFNFSGGTLEAALINDSLDVEWYWQGTGPTVSSARAYRIEVDSQNQNVPEPNTLALIGLALAGLGYIYICCRRPR